MICVILWMNIEVQITWEYGDKYVVLHGLTPTHEENIPVALERRKLAVLVSRADGSWRLLGSLNP
jgi:hypothetical protein